MPKKGEYKSSANSRTQRERAYDSTPARKKARAERNRARRKAIREGKVSVGDSKTVGHKKSIKKHGPKAAKKAGTRIESRRASNQQGAKISNSRQGKKRK